MNVSKYTRAGKNGRAISCIHCDAAVNKYDWRLADAN